MSAQPSPIADLADGLSVVLYRIAGWLLVGLGAVGLVLTVLRETRDAVPSNTGASLAVILVSLLFLAGGVVLSRRGR
jgi:drug/metabolite transporter (DMT)-like permease